MPPPNSLAAGRPVIDEKEVDVAVVVVLEGIVVDAVMKVDGDGNGDADGDGDDDSLLLNEHLVASYSAAVVAISIGVMVSVSAEDCDINTSGMLTDLYGRKLLISVVAVAVAVSISFSSKLFINRLSSRKGFKLFSIRD